MKNTMINPIGLSISMILLLGLLLSACSDDSPTVVPPEDESEFAIEFKVVDTQGDPVEGIELTLYNDHDYLQGKNHGKAMIQIRYSLGAEVNVLMHVNNAAGDSIRALVHGVQAEGYHSMIWDGEDDAGVRQNSGRYSIQMKVLSDDFAVVFADSLGILASQPDADMFVATSNANGVIILDDKCLFPQLYSLPDMMAADENGDPLGSFNVDDVMHAIYRDPVSMITMRAVINIGPDTSLVTYVWDPEKQLGSPVQKEMQTRGTAGPTEKIADPEDYEYSLDMAFPNPFN